MRRLLLVFVGVIVLILACFGLATMLDIPWLRDPLQGLQDRPGLAFSLSTALLAADVLLPVPSSLIMIGNGSVFGTMQGSLVSLIGGLAASLTGWGMGRLGSQSLQRYVGEEGLARAHTFLQRWGDLAILLSRPIPVLAEAVAILCGSLRVSPFRLVVFSALGLYPPCLLYAYAGSRAGAAPEGWQALLWVLGVALITWLVGRWLYPKRNGSAPKPSGQHSAV